MSALISTNLRLEQFVRLHGLGNPKFRLSAEDAKKVRDAENVSLEHAVKLLLELLFRDVH